MSKLEISKFFMSFGTEFSKAFKNVFEKPMNKFATDMQKNYKVLLQGLSGKKAKAEDLVKIYNDYIAGDEKAKYLSY